MMGVSAGGSARAPVMERVGPATAVSATRVRAARPCAAIVCAIPQCSIPEVQFRATRRDPCAAVGRS